MIKEHTAREPAVMKIPEKAFVKPSKMMPPTHMSEPPSMNGLRRPKRDFEWSARTPISGWTISPLNGPATNTIDIKDFESPSESKYGEAGRT